MLIQILAFDGVDEIDVMAPLEVFSTAHKLGTDVEARLVVHGTPRAITGRHGTSINVTDMWDPELPGFILVPGGNFSDPASPGIHAEIASGLLPSALAALPRQTVTVLSVCTGAMLLAAAGITTGRHATTHHAASAELESSGALVTDARVVDDGDLVTAGGVTSGLDLALWIVEREKGPQAARGVERILEYERRGVVWGSV